MKPHTSFFVQFSSGLTFTRLNFVSHCTTPALPRSAVWSLRMALIQASGSMPLDRAAQRQDLAVVAALVGAVDVQRAAVLRLVLRDRQFRADVLDLDAVARLDALAEFERFGELVAGVEVDDRRGGLDLGEHVDDAAPLGPERGGHQQPRVKPLSGPAQHFLRRRGQQPRDSLPRSPSPSPAAPTSCRS